MKLRKWQIGVMAGFFLAAMPSQWLLYNWIPDAFLDNAVKNPWVGLLFRTGEEIRIALFVSTLFLIPSVTRGIGGISC